MNRSAITVIPKQPYANWANSLDDHGPRFALSDENDALTVFLGPDLTTVEEVGAFVEKHVAYFFEHWLDAGAPSHVERGHVRSPILERRSMTLTGTHPSDATAHHLLRYLNDDAQPVDSPPSLLP